MTYAKFDGLFNLKSLSSRFGASPSDTASLGYVPAIDGLRSVAVLFVIIFHLGFEGVRGGFVGVDVFFVISGFVVAASVLAGRFDSFGAFLTFFYARRIVRIMPALILCLLVTSLLAAMFIPAVWLSDSNDRTGFAAFFGMSNITLALNSDTYFSPRTEFNPYTHTWSLGVEEQFYLIFPLLWFFWVFTKGRPETRGRVKAIFLVLSIASLLCAVVLTRWRPQYAFYLIFPRFWELGVGVLLAASVPAWSGQIRRLSVRQVDMVCACLVAALLASFFFADERYFPFPWALVPVATTGAIICMVVAVPQCALARGLSSGPMVFIGKRSYSLYLWHWPVFVLMRWTFGLETAGQRSVAILLTFLCALGAYRLVEDPLRHAPFVRRASRWSIVAVGLVCVFSAALLARTITKLRPHLSMSVTRDADIWFPQRSLDTSTGCAVDLKSVPFAGGDIRTFTSDCPKAQPPRVVYVLGDSHAGAYLPALQALTTKYGYTVEIYDKSGCPIFSFSAPNAEAAPECANFSKAAVESLASKVTRSDIVFLPTLRLPRFGSQFGLLETHQVDPAAQEAKRMRAVAEAVAALAPITARGASVVFEAPTPVFRSTPLRCSDWFNASNPVCEPGFEVARSELEPLRAPVLKAMDDVVRSVPGVSVWDPFPILCPGEVCHAFADGKPLFFDGDHLSRFGNQVLFESFTQALPGLPAQ